MVRGLSISPTGCKGGACGPMCRSKQTMPSAKQKVNAYCGSLAFVAAAQSWGNEWEFSPAVVGILLDD